MGFSPLVDWNGVASWEGPVRFEAQAHLPGVLLKRPHPHSLRSRRVQVEPAASFPFAGSRGTQPN